MCGPRQLKTIEPGTVKRKLVAVRLARSLHSRPAGDLRYKAIEPNSRSGTLRREPASSFPAAFVAGRGKGELAEWLCHDSSDC